MAVTLRFNLYRINFPLTVFFLFSSKVAHLHNECVTDTQICGAKFCDSDGYAFAVTGYDLSEIIRYTQSQGTALIDAKRGNVNLWKDMMTQREQRPKQPGHGQVEILQVQGILNIVMEYLISVSTSAKIGGR